MDNGASSYRRFLDGDETAFDQIMEEYADGLIFFIYRYVLDYGDAEDIAIDVFSDLLVHRNRYNFKIPLKNYLFMLGRSRALNFIKRRNRIKPVDLVEAEPLFTEKDFPEEMFLVNEQKQLVHQALRQLPAEMEAAIHLIYFEELSYEEAAKVMKKTRKQVDNLLYRAKKQLQRILGKEGMHL